MSILTQLKFHLRNTDYQETDYGLTVNNWKIYPGDDQKHAKAYRYSTVLIIDSRNISQACDRMTK